uniref:hypothetical protein n=1 Tax=uncultured Rhizobium sp. TaxID=155567 RepID=UPI00261AB484
GADYVIPIHEFSKAAILGEYSHYVSETSLAMNVFDVQTADRKEHFLCIMILTYLLSSGVRKDRDGFVNTNNIVQEMQRWGFVPDQTENGLRKLTNKRLIETTERITFEEDLLGLVGEVPNGFRPTSIGVYHVRRWIGRFSYLDAMVFDTPIFDEQVREFISSKLGSFDISDRYERTVAFRDYLSASWEASSLRPEYFDWKESVREGMRDFGIVNWAKGRRKTSRPRGGAKR